MLKIVTKVINTIICLIILVIPGVSCAGTSQPQTVKQTVTVQRGNLEIVVSVDGSLVMPQAFDLRFGAPGNVLDVLVDEGDQVKAGTVLARLDDASQRLDIKSANVALQLTLSNLYETIPAIQQGFMANEYGPTILDSQGGSLIYDPNKLISTDKYPQTTGNAGFPSYYPNSSAMLSLGWAQDELAKARDFFQRSSYGDAALELRIAVSDLESCIKVFQSAMEIMLPGSSTMPFVNLEDLRIWLDKNSPDTMYIVEWQRTIELIRRTQANLNKIQTLITQGNYAAAGAALDDSLSQMRDITMAIRNNVNYVKLRYDLDYPDRNICLYFYKAAEEKLNQALAMIQKTGLSWVGYNENVRTALHYMEMCNSLLGSNVMVLEHGLSLKNYQQYNVDLAKAAVTLANTKDNLLKTVIIAPFDGTVVSVGVKKNDILSAVDYSSRSAVQLVDTTQIKFQGQVDEIDILKIKFGQKATISVDAVPDRVFTGTITFISPSGVADSSNVVRFPLTIALDPSDLDLKGSLTATADIAISTSSNVLLVPVTAVSTTKEGSFVTVVTGPEQTEKRQITLGKQNQQFAEVVSGLKEGDTISMEQKLGIGAPVISRPQQRAPQVKGR